MKNSLLKSLLAIFCIFVVSIGSAFAISNINKSYAVTSYTITFYSNGGRFIEGNANVVSKTFVTEKAYFNQIIGISMYPKAGCTLDGWAVGSSNSNKIFRQYVESSDAGTSLYAHWDCSNPVKYTIAFNSTGGSVNYNSQSVLAGNTISNPGSPSKSGYKFLHWSTSADGSAYDFSTPVTSSFTLYAVWQKAEVAVKQYTVTFDTTGGSPSYGTSNITSGNTISNPGSPSKSGYKFLHWSTSAGGSAYDFSTPVTSSFTLYAVWEQNPVIVNPTPTPTPTTTYYDVVFNMNGGVGTIDSQKIEKNTKASLPSVEPTKENSNFIGWSENSNCKTLYDFTKKVTSNLTLYACFEDKIKVNLIKTGLPYIDNNSFYVVPNSNLQEYDKSDTIIIFDISTISGFDENVCIEKISNLKNSNAKEDCNTIKNNLNCNDNSCQGNRYKILSSNLAKEIIYLDKYDYIDIDYDIYDYLGLYKNNDCSDEYNYKSKITKDLDLYECYSVNESKDNDSQKSHSNFGKILTIIFVILLILSGLGLMIFYFVRRIKRANSVD